MEMMACLAVGYLVVMHRSSRNATNSEAMPGYFRLRPKLNPKTKTLVYGISSTHSSSRVVGVVGCFSVLRVTFPWFDAHAVFS